MLSMYFHHFLPFEKGVLIYFEKYEFLSFENALCQYLVEI